MENLNFGWVAIGLSVILNLLPIASFINFLEKKTPFEDIPGSKIYTNYISNLIWYFYGSLIFNKVIKGACILGGIFSLTLIIIYLFFEFKKYLIDSILNFIILIVGTMALFEWFSNIILEKNIVGKVCLATNILSIITQMPDIYNGIKEKNYLLIKVNYAIISFPTHLCWIIFGLIISDCYVLISNLICIICSIIQIILYISYKKDNLTINDDENVSTIGIDEEFKKEREESSLKEKPVEIINLK